MRSPSIIPDFDIDVYLVLDDFGKLGSAYRETDEEASDRDTIVRNLISGEYKKPIRVVAFNTSEGWARDVTEDTAQAVIDEAQRSGTLLHGSSILLSAQLAKSFHRTLSMPDQPPIIVCVRAGAVIGNLDR